MVKTAAPSETSAIVRTPAECFVEDRSHPTTEPAIAANMSLQINLSSVCIDIDGATHRIVVWATAAVDMASEAQDVLAPSNRQLSMVPRKIITLFLPLLFVTEEHN